LVGNIFSPAFGGGERKNFRLWTKLVGNIFSHAFGGEEKEKGSTILRHDQKF
jgi:hypothetical protein